MNCLEIISHCITNTAAQLNGRAEQPLQGGQTHITNQLLSFALFASRQGRNPEEPRSIFYDQYDHPIFVVDCIIKTALYVCEAFSFICLLAYIHVM